MKNTSDTQKREAGILLPVQHIEKVSQSFAAEAAKEVEIVFSGGMYDGENTSRAASVELSAFGGQPRRRAQRILLEKEPLALFRQSQREAGILLPVSALSGEYGIGTLGKCAYRFVDFLHRTGQRYWQILPVGPVGAGDSPYQCFSVFAGNPCFVDLNLLCDEGLLTDAELCGFKFGGDAASVDYAQVDKTYDVALRKAFERFCGGTDFEAFCVQNAFWLEDYSLFMAVKRENQNCNWQEWDEPIRMHEKSAVLAARMRLKREIDFWNFVQYEFDKQWTALHQYAASRGVKIMGDMPIYVAPDSADAWANAELFLMDERHMPTLVAGVPPDYFSETGQLWGNCLYDWEKMEMEDFSWWKQRVRAMAGWFDAIRIDHFIGFARYWGIPRDSQTAASGAYYDGPQEKIIAAIDAARGDTEIIAENLGLIVPQVRALIEKSGYPGMAVLQFAFGGGEDNDNLPRNTSYNTVVYTGTHDNDTTRGYLEKSSDWEKMEIRKTADLKEDDPITADTLVAMALKSAGKIAMIPMQDYLDFGSEARMNIPGTVGNNWKWRVRECDINGALEQKIKQAMKENGR